MRHIRYVFWGCVGVLWLMLAVITLPIWGMAIVIYNAGKHWCAGGNWFPSPPPHGGYQPSNGPSNPKPQQSWTSAIDSPKGFWKQPTEPLSRPFQNGDP